jgi:hypothetical protein
VYEKQFTGLASLSAAGLVEYDAPNINVAALAGLKSHKFGYGPDGNVITNMCTRLGSQPEHWRIHNLSAQIHNFHIHQMKFKVLAVRDAACTNEKPSLPGMTGKAFGLIDAGSGYIPENISTDALKGALDEQCVKTYAEVFHDVPASFKLVEANRKRKHSPWYPRHRTTGCMTPFPYRQWVTSTWQSASPNPNRSENMCSIATYWSMRTPG